MENIIEICEKAKQMYAEKKYTEAVELWKAASAENNSEALYMLGICYNYNLGVEEQDAEKRGVIASEYFIKSAELGHKDGMCFAGLCFLHGIGVEQDIQKAIEWFEKSAEQNSTQAMNNLGLLYKQNKAELEENESYEKSIEWFTKSASLNDSTGQLYLGKAYYDGVGVEQDYKTAVNYYKMAA